MVSCPTGALTNKGVVGTELGQGDILDPTELLHLPIFENVSGTFLELNQKAVVKRHYRAGEIVSGELARENRFGHLLRKPGSRRAFPDDQDAFLDAPVRKCADRFGEDVEAFLHDDPPKKGDDQFVVGEPHASTPFHIAPLGVELVAIDAARPDRYVSIHSASAQDGGRGFGRRHDNFAPAIEAAENRADEGFEPLEMIISEIGFEPRVDRSDRGDMALASPGYCPV